jgi:ankyrin repeat protein
LLLRNIHLADPRLLLPFHFLLDPSFNMSNVYDYERYELDEDDYDGAGEDSVLLTLVQCYEWAGALARIASNPEEASTVGIQGRTALHLACDQDAPAVVVQALLTAYPEASLMVGTSNMNPLHITCSSQHASVQVVRVLLESGMGQEASKRQDVDGDMPLHAACRCGAPMEVLEVLLRANPHAVNERDYEGLTPLLRLWVRYFVILGDDVIDAVKGPADLTGELGEAWNKTELLLRCAYLGSLDNEEGTSFRAVHAAAAVDCPRAVVKIATILHAHQVEELDEKHMTPLLIAAKAPIFKVRDLSDEGYLLEDRIHGDENQENSDVEDHSDGDSQQPSVIEILVTASSDPACVPDSTGRLPLHLAIASGKVWTHGVKAILDANPDALMIQDSTTKLYPFLLAAETLNSETNTIFELLRSNPALIQCALENVAYHENTDVIHEEKKSDCGDESPAVIQKK